MRQQVVDMYQEPSWWTWSQELWIQLEQVLSVNYSDQTTLSSVNLELVTTGQKATIQRVPNSSTQFLTLSERKLRDVTASKAFKSLILLEEELAQAWELFLSLKSERSIQTELCAPSLLCHLLRYLILSLSHTMQLCQSISLSKMQMKLCALTMRLYMISASELWNWQPLPMVILTTWCQLPFLV